MKLYYEALDKEGDIVSGDIDAQSERAAMRQLESDGLTITAFKEPKEPARSIFVRKLKQQEVQVALHELATLLESGVSIAEAVESQAASEYHPDLKVFFEFLTKNLKKGESFSAAVTLSRLTLPEYFIQLIEAGELSGTLAKCLRQGVAQMEYELEIANEFRNALIYPSILVFSGVGAVLLIFLFVVPKFGNLIKADEELPLLAEFVLSTGLWVNDNIYAFLGGAVILVLTIANALRSPNIRQQVMNRLAVMPVIGPWLTEIEVAKWSAIMSALLFSRVDLLSALDMAQKSVKIQSRNRRLNQVTKAVKTGESLSKALQDNKVLSSTAYNLIRVGEKSGRLPEMLASIAKIYDNNCRNRMKKILLMIEPAAILIIGIVIGVLILGIILAITSANDISI